MLYLYPFLSENTARCWWMLVGFLSSVKGVLVSQKNLLFRLRLCEQKDKRIENSKIVCWFVCFYPILFSFSSTFKWLNFFLLWVLVTHYFKIHADLIAKQSNYKRTGPLKYTKFICWHILVMSHTLLINHEFMTIIQNKTTNSERILLFTYYYLLIWTFLYTSYLADDKFMSLLQIKLCYIHACIYLHHHLTMNLNIGLTQDNILHWLRWNLLLPFGANTEEQQVFFQR